MGLFDSFTFDCIFCGERLEEQTKAGPCMLEEYKFEEPTLPLWLMECMDGSEVECYKCRKKQRLIFDLEIKVKRKEIIPTDNLDFIELEAKRRGLNNLNSPDIIRREEKE